MRPGGKRLSSITFEPKFLEFSLIRKFRILLPYNRFITRFCYSGRRLLGSLSEAKIINIKVCYSVELLIDLGPLMILGRYRNTVLKLVTVHHSPSVPTVICYVARCIIPCMSYC